MVNARLTIVTKSAITDFEIKFESQVRKITSKDSQLMKKIRIFANSYAGGEVLNCIYLREYTDEQGNVSMVESINITEFL